MKKFNIEEFLYDKDGFDEVALTKILESFSNNKFSPFLTNKEEKKEQLKDLNKYLDLLEKLEKKYRLPMVYYFYEELNNLNFNSAKISYWANNSSDRYFICILDEKIIFYYAGDYQVREEYYVIIKIYEYLLENYGDRFDVEDLKYTVESTKEALKPLENQPDSHSIDFNLLDDNINLVEKINRNIEIDYYDVKKCLSILNNKERDYRAKYVASWVGVLGIKNILLNYKNSYLKSIEVIENQNFNEFQNINEFLIACYKSFINYIESIEKEKLDKYYYTPDYKERIWLKNIKNSKDVKSKTTEVVSFNPILKGVSNDQDCNIFSCYNFYIYLLLINKKYKEARKIINNNSFNVFSRIKNNLEKFAEHSSKILLKDVLYAFDAYMGSRKENWNIGTDDHLAKLMTNEDFKNRYLYFFLECVIEYYKLLKYEKNEDEAKKTYQFLQYFETGFGIEDFFMKIKYEDLLNKISNIKSNVDDDNEEDIDKKIDKIVQEIEKNDLFKSSKEKNISKIYSNINFKNLEEKTIKFLSTGLDILNYANQNEIEDYSCVSIEWSKAVELELYSKLLKSIPNEYQKKIEKKYDIKITKMIGTFEAIRKTNNLEDKLYNDIYSKKYNNFKLEDYKNMCDYIIELKEIRNDSAHKDGVIDKNRAMKCEELALSTMRILEILSKLEKTLNSTFPSFK